MLEALEGVSGYPLLSKAGDLAAARTFGRPSLLPADYTGKAVARQVGGGLLGGAVAGPIGAALGAASASPAALKFAINAGNAVGSLPSLVEWAKRNPIAIQALLTRGVIAPGAEEFFLGVSDRNKRSPSKNNGAIDRAMEKRKK